MMMSSDYGIKFHLDVLQVFCASFSAILQTAQLIDMALNSI